MSLDTIIKNILDKAIHHCNENNNSRSCHKCFFSGTGPSICFLLDKFQDKNLGEKAMWKLSNFISYEIREQIKCKENKK